MNEEQRGIINLVKSALTGTAISVDENLDFNNAIKIAVKNGITTLIYYGALNSGISTEKPHMQRLFVYTCKNVVVSEQQHFEVLNILKQFDQSDIEYMPLKGVLLKKMYIKPEMRIMSDADILIKTDQYDKIKEIMLKSGYEENVESDHELTWFKGGICIELHKRLIPSYNHDYYAYFGDGWRLAKVKDGNRYSMTDEDQMIYLFTHFAKHYRDGGIGIRHIVDLWVYRNNKPDLNEKYIISELKKLQLADFYSNIIDTLDTWFGEKEENGITDFITQVIFQSGMYGTREGHILSDALRTAKITKKDSVRANKFFVRMFPSYKNMRSRYKFLGYLPFLLPFMWLIRGVGILFTGYDKIKLRADEYRVATTEKITDYGESLKFVGLDFNFEEK